MRKGEVATRKTFGGRPAHDVVRGTIEATRSALDRAEEDLGLLDATQELRDSGRYGVAYPPEEDSVVRLALSFLASQDCVDGLASLGSEARPAEPAG